MYYTPREKQIRCPRADTVNRSISPRRGLGRAAAAGRQRRDRELRENCRGALADLGFGVRARQIRNILADRGMPNRRSGLGVEYIDGDARLIAHIGAVPAPAAIESAATAATPAPIAPAAPAGVVVIEDLSRADGIADHALGRGWVCGLDALGG